jgi:hypothetical protein
MCGSWYGIQEFSARIWYIIISIGIKRNTKGVECVVGGITEEECPLSLRDWLGLSLG